MSEINSNEGGRIAYLDAAKAIAIILMILGHCVWRPYGVYAWIYSFHMPLFFIISGMFIKKMELKSALSKNGKRLVYPYIIACLLVICANLLGTVGCGGDILGTLWDTLVKSILVSGFRWGSPLIPDFKMNVGAVWFLIGLFWGTVILSWLEHRFNRQTVITIIALMACFSACSVKKIMFPFHVQAGMLSCIYLYLGQLTREYGLLQKINDIPTLIKVVAVMSWLTLPLFISILDIGISRMGFSIVSFIISIIGCATVMTVCSKVSWDGGWIGRNTLYILVAHHLWNRSVAAMWFDMHDLPFNKMANFSIEAIISILFAVVVGWLLSKTKILDYNIILKLVSTQIRAKKRKI